MQLDADEEREISAADLGTGSILKCTNTSDTEEGSYEVEVSWIRKYSVGITHLPAEAGLLSRGDFQIVPLYKRGAALVAGCVIIMFSHTLMSRQFILE